MTQRNKIKIGILLVAFLLPWTLYAQKGEKITTVVIDPGHGGKDTGALGAISKEKDLNLTVALLAGDYIKKNLPDVKVVYTRERDVFVTLNDRAEIANRNNADVFISIHCNSVSGKNASAAVGAETFVLGEHKNAANLEVAKKENSAILLEDDAAATYDNFDLDSPEAYIALSLFQKEYLNQSLNLAAKVQEQFTTRVGRKDRGVQQAGFLVLWKTAMPSILIELGFLSNPAEERFLASEDGQTFMASAIYRAFRDFKKSYEGENNNSCPVGLTEVDLEPVKEPVQSQEAPQQLAQQTNPGGTQPQKPAQKDEPAVSFKVQFATRDTNVPVSSKDFAKVPEVDVYFYNGAYRYTSGSFASKQEAVDRQAEVRKLGFSDAFVVAFIKGERATIKEAENYLQKK